MADSVACITFSLKICVPLLSPSYSYVACTEVVTTTQAQGVCTEEENQFSLNSALQEKIADMTSSTNVDLPTGEKTGTSSAFNFKLEKNYILTLQCNILYIVVMCKNQLLVQKMLLSYSCRNYQLF